MADIVRTHHRDLLARWSHVLSREQRKALRNIRDCRSAALGGRVEQCTIRQFGFLANRVRKSKLELCRTLLADRLPAAHSGAERGEVNEEPQRCPICQLGRLLMVELIAVARMTIPDTS